MGVSVPDRVVLSILNRSTAAAGPLDGAKINLYKNDVTPNPLSQVSDFQAADYTGYAADTAVLWAPAYDDPEVGPVVWSQLIQFQPTDPVTVSNTVYGWYMEDGAGNFLAGERFDTPRAMNSHMNAVRLTAGFALDTPSGF